MKTPLERFEEAVNRKMPCKFCNGTGEEDFEKIKNMTIYGRDMKNIAEIIDYAYQHGYTDK